MKIIAEPPLQLGMMVSSFDPPQFVGCFFGKLTCKLVPGVVTPSDEPDLVSGDVYADDDLTKPLLYPSDFVPKKPRVDVVVNAAAHAPGKVPVPQLDVSMSLGPIAKTLRVFGKRLWKQGMLARSPGGPAEPFAVQPIGYQFAIGGPGAKQNPAGMGLDGEEMPRVEDPKALLTRPRGDVPPGFGAIPPAWPQRFELTGSYRGNYVKERWPWFPTNFDFGYFNAAPRDQQIDGDLKGDEKLILENLHPAESTFRTRLPGLRLRLFANIRAGDLLTFREIPVRLDTVWVDVPTEKLALVWRGHINVSTPKMREIEHLLLWTEPRAEPAKPLSHYQALLAEHLAEAVEAPEPPDPPTPDDDDAAFEAEFAATDKELAAAEASLEALAAKEAATKAQPIVAATKSAADDLRAMLANTPNLPAANVAEIQGMIAEMQSVEAEFTAMDAEFDADFPPDATLDKIRAGEAGDGPYSLDGQDLAGRDLTKIDWRGSSFAKANLAGAKLSGVRLDDANLIGANLSGADLTGANLNGADLTGAALEGAKFAGAILIEARLVNHNLAGVDFTGCDAAHADFSGSNLRGAKLAQVKLVSADLSKCTLEKADFRGANLARADLGGVQATGANFDGADLSHASGASKGVFVGANFRKVVGLKVVFESALLDKADFSRAKLVGAQFGEASLREANFDRADLATASFDDADLRKAKLTNANLLRAGFDRADMTEANLEGSNAYEAGFWLAQTKDANLKNANLRHTLLG